MESCNHPAPPTATAIYYGQTRLACTPPFTQSVLVKRPRSADMATVYTRSTPSSTGASGPPDTVNPHNAYRSPSTDSHNSSVSGDSRVNFKVADEEESERRKYLTAKYGAHQMRLIRKRLAVEDWLDKELRKLYDTTDDADTYDCEIDMDELLDVDEVAERRRFVLSKLANCRKSQDVLNKFVIDILEKADTL